MGNFVQGGRLGFSLFAQETHVFVYIIKYCEYTKLKVYKKYVKNQVFL